MNSSSQAGCRGGPGELQPGRHCSHNDAHDGWLADAVSTAATTTTAPASCNGRIGCVLAAPPPAPPPCCPHADEGVAAPSTRTGGGSVAAGAATAASVSPGSAGSERGVGQLIRARAAERDAGREGEAPREQHDQPQYRGSQQAVGPPNPPSPPGCHIGAEDDAPRCTAESAERGRDVAPRPVHPAKRRDRGELLNAIESALGDDIYDAFPLYLRAIGISVVMGRSVEETRLLMARHLRDKGVLVSDDDDAPWEIVQSPLGGRGVVATRDLDVGDLVLVDAPLVLGSRAGSDPSTLPICVGCLQPRTPAQLRACPRGCRLPVCTGQSGAAPSCADQACHVGECALLLRWGVKGDAALWSETLLRASAAVRCLALPPDQREILASMQSHHGRQHAFEVDLLLEALEDRPKPEEERFMRLACCVMDANAFRMTLPGVAHAEDDVRRHCAPTTTETWGPATGALRGLYPLGALLNHECTPNTRHSYDPRGNMVIRVARAVTKGQELTVTYSALLWGSPARRQHLLRTKHFLCTCPRCKDPTEGGTFLTALPCPCPSRRCPGPVLPASPLSLTGPWRCWGCELDVPAERATLLQSVLGGLLRTLYVDPTRPPQPDAILRFLEDNRHLLPASNHITVELKAGVVWTLGRGPGLAFAELSGELLQLKEDLIRELLGVLRALQAGRCSLAGMLLYELHCTLMEKCRRDPGHWTVVGGEALDALKVADEVLGDDNAAPSDLADLVRRARLLPSPGSPGTTPVQIPHSEVGTSSPSPAPTPSSTRPRSGSSTTGSAAPAREDHAEPEPIACL